MIMEMTAILRIMIIPQLFRKSCLENHRNIIIRRILLISRLCPEMGLQLRIDLTRLRSLNTRIMGKFRRFLLRIQKMCKRGLRRRFNKRDAL